MCFDGQTRLFLWYRCRFYTLEKVVSGGVELGVFIVLYLYLLYLEQVIAHEGKIHGKAFYA